MRRSILNRPWWGSGLSSRKDSLLFRFNLEQVLNFRRQVEESKEFGLAQARRVMQQEEDRLSFFEDRRDHYQRELVERQKEGVSPREVVIYNAYTAFLKEKIELQIEAVESARKQVEERKEELLAARKDRKILDRLRSRKYEVFLAEMRREEMKHLDEVAVTRFQARTRERRE